MEQAMYFLPYAGGATDEFNQCVFVRYYTVRPGWWGLFPKVIRAGAGPHDLGPGDSRRGAHLESTVLSGAEPTAGGDKDLGGQRGSIDDSADSEPDIVVRNTPSEEEHDSWYAIADYVFQNSNATSVLMHHRDLAEIHAVAGFHGISSMLGTKRPRIVVEKDGVARIIWRENRQLAQQGTCDPPFLPPANSLSSWL
ncbi:hypothetical protein BDM02DRAFT_991490 [Thelephora ganbajun]|uniref:Uncharacterized protein n=1 Tax=Thelephora ganbajun TaxID=370292 RepID=A0ACB6Z467_THEGA|nr:hypothetical protein BDM02DRAFT_991490 [Thelephora ganbajun]